MPLPIIVPTHVIKLSSVITFFDLFRTDYDQFSNELDHMHGQMQWTATNSTANTYWRFAGQLWWYCISYTPSTKEYTNPLWHSLHGHEAYQDMLAKLSSTFGTENATLELTNNLEYIDSDMTLPTSSYPRTTITNQKMPVIIYPAYFTLRPVALVRLPPASDTLHPKIYPPHPQIYTTLNRAQLSNFEHGFPPGLALQPHPTTTPLTPWDPSSSSTHPTPQSNPTPTTPTLETLPGTPISLHIFPMTALPTLPVTPITPLDSWPSSPPPGRSSTSHHITHTVPPQTLDQPQPPRATTRPDLRFGAAPYVELGSNIFGVDIEVERSKKEVAELNLNQPRSLVRP